jgi:alkylhydroperoxidase family enzyme
VGGLSDRDRALCRVAAKLSASPTRMVEADWEPLRATGLSERGCLEVAHVVGLFNHLTRLADGFGLRLDDAVAEASRSGEPLRRHGR